MSVVSSLQALDPRLKLAVALVLGPCLWKVPFVAAGLCCLVLFFLAIPLMRVQPLGPKMVRSLIFFVCFWVALKVALDGLTGEPLDAVLMDGAQLGVRLAALLLLGLTLSLSTSARTLGLAVSWAVRPFVGAERAWRIALSLALMIHFLPLCLSTMASVRETVDQRCPESGFRHRMVVIPQAVIRNLGQKTWNQTLAIAGRGLDCPEAWVPDLSWRGRDWAWLVLSAACLAAMFAF